MKDESNMKNERRILISWITFLIIAASFVIFLMAQSCEKQTVTPITQIECKGKLPGIIGNPSYNPDGSTIYQFNKLDYSGKTYSGGTITVSENASMKVWKSKQTVFWTQTEGAQIVVHCYTANGSVVELDGICPYECDGCIDDPNMPGCPHAFVVY